MRLIPRGAKPTYERLPGDHVRPLCILPDKDGKHIQCQLVATNMYAGVVFPALSYVWGMGEVTMEILMNGQMMSISSHLHSFLVQIREEHKPVAIWVDAICINQIDDADKGAQISLMPKIYGAAYRTLIWLGSKEHTPFVGEGPVIRIRYVKDRGGL
jgi:hypothetical protein